MKKYFNHIQNKPPHERRQHAIQIATVFTALVFVVWITTLGVRLANTSGVVAQNPDGSDQVANASSIYDTPENTLEVATTSTGTTITLPYAQ